MHVRSWILQIQKVKNQLNNFTKDKIYQSFQAIVSWKPLLLFPKCSQSTLLTAEPLPRFSGALILLVVIKKKSRSAGKLEDARLHMEKIIRDFKSLGMSSQELWLVVERGTGPSSDSEKRVEMFRFGALTLHQVQLLKKSSDSNRKLLLRLVGNFLLSIFFSKICYFCSNEHA